MKQQQNKTAVFISFRLEGENAELFLDYKKAQFLKNTAEARRKLMLERLHQVTSTRKSTSAKRPKYGPTEEIN